MELGTIATEDIKRNHSGIKTLLSGGLKFG